MSWSFIQEATERHAAYTAALFDEEFWQTRLNLANHRLRALQAEVSRRRRQRYDRPRGHPNVGREYIDQEIGSTIMNTIILTSGLRNAINDRIDAEAHDVRYFRDHPRAYYDYALHLAHLTGTEIIVGGEVQTITEDRLRQLHEASDGF